MARFRTCLSYKLQLFVFLLTIYLLKHNVIDEMGKTCVRECIFCVKQETLKTSSILFANLISILISEVKFIDKYYITRPNSFKFTKLRSSTTKKTMNDLANYISFATKRRNNNI